MNGPASPIPFQFTEDMKGYVTFAQTNYQDGFDQGKRDGNFLMFHLTLKTGDLDRFLTVKEHEADAIGYVECALLGGRCPVERGWFNLFGRLGRLALDARAVVAHDIGHLRLLLGWYARSGG